MAKPTYDEMWNAFNDLRRSLNAAYWEIGDQKEADRLLALAHDIDSIQDDMDRKAIISNTAEYKKLKGRVEGVTQKLKAVQESIDDIVHKVETVTKVIGYIEQAVKLAAKYFV